MRLVKALSLVLVVTAAALITYSASAARTKTLHFRVTSATASATLTFHSADTAADETTDGKIVLKASPKSRATASVPGRASFALKGTVNERVITRRQVSSTSPYQETCANTRKVAGKGGVTLRRVGTKIQAKWAFPQATPSFCDGPKAGASILKKMTKTISAKVFNSAHPTVVLSGSAKSTADADTTLTYRWRAVVKLARG